MGEGLLFLPSFSAGGSPPQAQGVRSGWAQRPVRDAPLTNEAGAQRHGLRGLCWLHSVTRLLSPRVWWFLSLPFGRWRVQGAPRSPDRRGSAGSVQWHLSTEPSLDLPSPGGPSASKGLGFACGYFAVKGNRGLEPVSHAPPVLRRLPGADVGPPVCSAALLASRSPQQQSRAPGLLSQVLGSQPPCPEEHWPSAVLRASWASSWSCWEDVRTPCSL